MSVVVVGISFHTAASLMNSRLSHMLRLHVWLHIFSSCVCHEHTAIFKHSRVTLEMQERRAVTASYDGCTSASDMNDRHAPWGGATQLKERTSTKLTHSVLGVHVVGFYNVILTNKHARIFFRLLPPYIYGGGTERGLKEGSGWK